VNIDDSYELQRQIIFSGNIGIKISVDRLGGEIEDVYSNQTGVKSHLENETNQALGEVQELSVVQYHVGRSSEAVAAILMLGGGITWLVSRAKNIDEGIKTIKKWGTQIKAWRIHFEQKGHCPHFTVEALKVLCAADLYDRFDISTEPQLGLIRADAACTRGYDGRWIDFGPVYVFVPDKRKKVTHLFAITYEGEILHRSEIPPFELESPILEYLDEELGAKKICLPDRTKDPDVEDWEKLQKQLEDDRLLENG
jgi:hypothetical protein